MIQRILLSLTLSAASFAVLAQDTSGQDTAPSGDDKITELSEIVVTGDNVWIEGNKVIFKPQKSAKNLATDATSLIDRMNTGLLRVEKGSIVARSGQPVAVYINGVKADGMDLSTFWPKNALRVEYMEYPDDPRFAGEAQVVNFIMKEYVTGGLTKLNGNQEIPNSGSYSASSKLVYKKMTYNAIFSGRYSRDHLSGDDRNESYSDIWYEGQHYDLVERNERTDYVNRSDKLYGGLNARYRTDKTIITHSAALQWTRDPESTSSGSLLYSPEIIGANSMYSLSRARSLSPSLTGDYYFQGSDKLIYRFGWSFNHTHNNNFSQYSETALTPILNNVRENIYNYSATAIIGYSVSKKLGLNFKLDESRSVSSSTYTGTVESKQWQQTGNTNFKVDFKYAPIKAVYISLTPQINLQDWNVNHTYKKTSWLPGVGGNIYWTVNSKNYLSISAYYFQRTPDASMRNDLILRQTELKWIEGNPEMKTSRYQSFHLNWYSSPLSWLTSNMSVSYDASNGDSYIAYRAGGREYDGVIGQYHSAVREDAFMLFWYLGIKLFDGHLLIDNHLQYNYSQWNNEAGLKVGNWYTRPSITWNFGNCSLRASYNSPQKTGTFGGTGVSRYPYQCGLAFSYGNGNLNLDVEADNIFQKRMNQTLTLVSGPYRYVSNSWNNGRSLSVRLTYTFDYGKKVDPGVEIYEQNVKSSAILGAE